MKKQKELKLQCKDCGKEPEKNEYDLYEVDR